MENDELTLEIPLTECYPFLMAISGSPHVLKTEIVKDIYDLVRSAMSRMDTKDIEQSLEVYFKQKPSAIVLKFPNFIKMLETATGKTLFVGLERPPLFSNKVSKKKGGGSN